VGVEQLPVAVGVVSVGTRNVPKNSEPRLPPPNSGYLGIRPILKDNAVKILQILPDGGAAKAGLKTQDIIVAIAGKTISDVDSLLDTLQAFKPGDEVEIRVRRGEEELDVKAKLARRPQSRSDMQNNLGSELSKRRTGFPTILQHDSVLRPSDCGGPLVDLDGKTVGINIARAGRTESYAIPSEVVQSLITDMIAGKHPPRSEKQAREGK
jgi:serine protease Do